MISQTFSHYKIIEKLRRKGMGVIYKAGDISNDKPDSKDDYVAIRCGGFMGIFAVLLPEVMLQSRLNISLDLGAVEAGFVAHFAGEIRNSFPVPFVIVGLAVLLLRLEEPYVWLLALLFASWSTAPSVTNGFENREPEGLRHFALAYRATFYGLLGPLSYFFFALFPVRSPVERRVPWLKWIALLRGLLFAVPGIPTGDIRLPNFAQHWVAESFSRIILQTYTYALIALGLVSLAANAFHTEDPEAKRKIRVIFWGAVVGIAPALLVVGTQTFAGIQLSSWMIMVVSVLLFIFPRSPVLGNVYMRPPRDCVASSNPVSW